MLNASRCGMSGLAALILCISSLTLKCVIRSSSNNNMNERSSHRKQAKGFREGSSFMEDQNADTSTVEVHGSSNIQ